jgi:hypothetical protein
MKTGWRTLALALAAASSGCLNLAPNGPTRKADTMGIQDAYRNLRFAKSSHGGAEPRPSWWRCRPEEIAETCEGVRRGEARIVGRTAAGFPLYAVFYGTFDDQPRQSNWSAAGSSGSYASYYGEPEKQTIVWATGFHGAEPEGVVATLNMIQMIETGTDFRGRTYPRILELLDRYRIIFLPCVNMDGRAISPDHLKGTDKATFRKACQGEWPDGRPIEWRESKEHFPLPLDRVKHPGGYPNADGYNIMHDATPGNIRTEEARAVLGLVERYGADFLFNGHSCEGTPFMIMPSEINYQVLVGRGMDLADEINGRLAKAGLREGKPKKAPTRTLNFNNLVSLTSGGLALTLECSSWAPSFDDMVEPCFIALEVVLAAGLRAPLSDRQAILRGLE